MCGSPTAQAALVILRALVACWYTYVVQVHTHLQVGLHHGRGGVGSGASCQPFESSGAKLPIQPTVLNRYTHCIARYRTTRNCGHSAIYHRKLYKYAQYTFKFSDKQLAYIVTQCP